MNELQQDKAAQTIQDGCKNWRFKHICKDGTFGINLRLALQMNDRTEKKRQEIEHSRRELIWKYLQKVNCKTRVRLLDEQLKNDENRV
jgi:hypothetical protein